MQIVPKTVESTNPPYSTPRYGQNQHACAQKQWPKRGVERLMFGTIIHSSSNVKMFNVWDDHTFSLFKTVLCLGRSYILPHRKMFNVWDYHTFLLVKESSMLNFLHISMPLISEMLSYFTALPGVHLFANFNTFFFVFNCKSIEL